MIAGFVVGVLVGCLMVWVFMRGLMLGRTWTYEERVGAAPTDGTVKVQKPSALVPDVPGGQFGDLDMSGS
jgi:hypothetical protein